MKHRVIVLFSALLVTGCNEILGLGGDFSLTPQSGGAGGGSQSTSGGSTTSATNGTGSASGSGTGGGTGSGMQVEPTCEEYCATIGANCTGANIEYPESICPVMCGHMAKGHVGDTSGDTVGCRLGKAMLAASDPVTYCQQAGPLGVDGCAEPCDAFCTLVFATCFESESNPFMNFTQCQEECAAIAYLRLDEGGSDLTTTAGNNLNCWLYHLQVANTPTNPNAALAHCGHIGPGHQCY
ncbi:MAG: hypothetical protein U0414_43705 [Polyangiaceae bacterium]